MKNDAVLSSGLQSIFTTLYRYVWSAGEHCKGRKIVNNDDYTPNWWFHFVMASAIIISLRQSLFYAELFRWGTTTPWGDIVRARSCFYFWSIWNDELRGLKAITNVNGVIIPQRNDNITSYNPQYNTQDFVFHTCINSK